jgi:Fe-S-cluster containining protein
MRKLKVLPPMQCDEGCGECCGPVPVTETEYQRVRRFMRERGIRARNNGLITCPLYQDGRCSVYEARPTLCRVFGHVPKMACSRGHNVNVDDHHVHRMLRSMGAATRMLHDLLGEP